MQSGQTLKRDLGMGEVLWVDPVRDDGHDVGVVGPELRDGRIGTTGEIVRTPIHTGNDHQHRQRQIGGDAGVQRVFGRTGHVGVVRAHDKDEIVTGGDVLIAVEDLGQGLVGILVRCFVGDAACVVVRLLDARTSEKYVDQSVAHVAIDERTEDADRADLTHENVE